MNQANLFEAEDAERAASKARSAEENHRWSWATIWGWDGPAAGELCEVGMPIVETAAGGRLYCYWEQCRLIQQVPDGRWIAEICMGEVHGQPWAKDGTRIILSIMEMDPPRRWIQQSRLEAHDV